MEAIVDELIRLGAAVAGLVLVPLLTAALVKLLQRTGLQVSAEREAQLRTIVRNAINHAEEFAAKAAKQKIGTLDGATKLSIAASSILTKVPGITEAEAAQLVHEELPNLGLGASDFLRSVRTAATTEPAK